jgi:diguanylate cyclase (GGDEF)-like protein/PAS domain S-box-containing protein
MPPEYEARNPVDISEPNIASTQFLASKTRSEDSINPTKLARLFDASSACVAVVRARDLVVVDVNSAFESCTGIKREAILGRTSESFDLWRNPEHRRLIIAEITAAKRFVSKAVSFNVGENRYADGFLSVEPFHFSGEAFFLFVTQDIQFYDTAEAALVRPMACNAELFQTSLALDQARVESDRLKERYRIVVEHSREGVYIVQNGVIVFANPALMRELGYDDDQLIGINYTEVLVDPRDRDFMRERIALRASGGIPDRNYEIRALRKDGVSRLFTVRADALELDDGIAITGTMRDITDARANDEKLLHAQDRYRKLFENAVVGMFQTDGFGNLQEANAATLRMFGFTTFEQMRSNFASLLPAFADARERELIQAAMQSGSSLENIETRMIHRDGHEFWVSMAMRCAASEGEGDQTLISIEGSMQDISARRLAELQLKFQANHDSLTRLPNRARFEAILGEYLDRLRNPPQRISIITDDAHWVLLLDLDGFKVVNDSLGHAAGDELLVMICDRMIKKLPYDLVLSRYGGDEFALVTRSAMAAQVSTEIAEGILGVLSQPFLVRGQQIFASASVGISRMDVSYKDAQQVMRDADTAMYRAKALGKSRYEVFDGAMHRAAQDRLQLETDLRFALERGEFVTYYQPIVELASGKITGAEALTRWQHPLRGLLLPGEFIVVAEESGLLIGVDWYVIDQSCRQLARWQKEFGDNAPGSISVNISDRLFASRGFSGSLGDLLRSTGINPNFLQLEITETVFRGNYAETLVILRELKAIGVRLLVDDFGTGYSSLVSFTHATFDGLKIDRGFIEDIENNERNRALVKTMCQFARDLNMSVVCEGVERLTQTEILLELGCVLGQGFRYAPALPPEAFASRLQLSSHALA